MGVRFPLGALMAARTLEFWSILGIFFLPLSRRVDDNEQVMIHRNRFDLAVYSTEEDTTVRFKRPSETKWSPTKIGAEHTSLWMMAE